MVITNTIETNPITGDVVVYWTIVDDVWTYMDIYNYTAEEWANTTPDQIQARQLNQYTAWREYCSNPTEIDLSQVVRTTIHTTKEGSNG